MTGFFVRKKDMETQWKWTGALDWHLFVGGAINSCLAQCEGDLNGNLTVDNDDLMMLLSQYGMDCDESLGSTQSSRRSTTIPAANRATTASTNSSN